MKKGLDNNGLIFMADLLDCMIDEINYTIYSTPDPDLLRLMEYEKNKILLAFEKLNNFITIRRLKDYE